MADNVKYLEFFENNKDNPDALEKFIGLSALIHVSPARRTPILQQIERAKNKEGKITKAWDKFEQRNKGKSESEALYQIIQLGLENNNYLERVINLMAYLISIPQLRLFTQPLLEETNFINAIPLDHPLISIFDYFLSYQYQFDKGVLTYKEATSEYNKFIINFQDEINKIDPNLPLSKASINELQSYSYIYGVLSEVPKELIAKILNILNITPSNDSNHNLYSISRALQPPQDSQEKIPSHILPIRSPPDIVYPQFTKYALSMTDATLQVFLQKRYNFANNLMDLLKNVLEALNPNNEVRFHRNAVPLRIPSIQTSNSKKTGIIINLALDPTFLQWDIQGFSEGEIIYLLNVIDSFENEENNILCVGCIVKNVLANHTLQVKVDADDVPSRNYNAVVKLPLYLNRDGQKLLELANCINIENIPKKVLDSFIGFKNSQGPGISLIEYPFGTTCIDHAARFVTENFVYGEKTLVICPNTQIIDNFLRKMKNFEKNLIPSFYYLRLDMSPEISFQVAVRTKDQILQTLIDSGIDKAWCQSCLTAINFLKSDNKIDKTVIDCLEQLRPLEYLGSVDKCVDYLKKNVAQIVFQLSTQELKFENIKFKNLVVLDNFLVQDSDIIRILTSCKPEVVKFYGQKSSEEFNKFFNLDPAFRRMITSSTYNKEFYSIIDQKDSNIINFIQKFNQNSEIHEPITIPVIVNPCHYFETSSQEESIEISIASAFFLRMTGLNPSEILIVVPNDEICAIAVDLMKKRASWNPNLLLMKERIVAINKIIQENLDAFAICGDLSFQGFSDINEISLFLADRATGILLLSGPKFDGNMMENVNDLKIAFGEKFGKIFEKGERNVFDVLSSEMFLQLVYHMQCQIAQ
ncbi:hypothetical protein TVAG_178820 [Trichomonas vaginalis G3]|uniref:Uncharacterized protein n=1 Tax=Trichomonas vaginalis (strain ATCC PRA-98 / G3) TaxID=412133 RepID=A2FR53_TRIV3|nr:hypothetical protein TVAGG3_0231850 [Trichomonas vaginalis G3]EAX92605.1 hypothetical protein TVAG_178820 [Trichomonas vaginalis G3]KAI5552692.1 hypothetical protein TVAGG3_0231850 [Trichomonas vaginalis G3]|eukprot:XP_001305535.1 hypothetical protein [Trichomonas vaginalis G3]